jgi:predicted RNA binding protein YcfA (HicA-like mRNA interferase family)
VKRKDLIKKLEAVGYRLDRTSDHAIYEKPGNRPVQFPNHREINEYTSQSHIKNGWYRIGEHYGICLPRNFSPE